MILEHNGLAVNCELLHRFIANKPQLIGVFGKGLHSFYGLDRAGGESTMGEP